VKQVDGRVAHMTDTTRHQSWQSTPLPDHAGSIPGCIYCHGDAPPLTLAKGVQGGGGGGGLFHQIFFFNLERQYPVTITTIIPPHCCV
jgi:hypothetical protein